MLYIRSLLYERVCGEGWGGIKNTGKTFVLQTRNTLDGTKSRGREGRRSRGLAHGSAAPLPVSEVDDHDGDVVQGAAVIRLQGDALRAVVRLVQALLHEGHRLLVTEGVPQPVGRQDQELRPVVGQVEGQHVRVCDHQLLVLEGVVAHRPGRRQDAGNSPHAVERHEAAGLLDALPLPHLQTAATVNDTDRVHPRYQILPTSSSSVGLSFLPTLSNYQEIHKL